MLDAEWFARTRPATAKMHGQQLYLDAMADCAALVPGEISAGLEPIAPTIEAIDRITALGAFPRCAFSGRPTGPTSKAGRHRTVSRCGRDGHVYQPCHRHWLPIGAERNIEAAWS
jgi:hypothetical protein